jgi:adenosylcobinamide kinase / adenosylcobinamide-phosphate guanylyltransferase
MPVTLVLGGARSGKSAYAQRLAEDAAARAGTAPVMIATAQGLDAEMSERIARHRAERGEGWRTVEAPLDVAAAVAALGAGEAAVVDCLTLWVSNLTHARADVDQYTDDLLRALAAASAEIVVVSNELGLGVVPDNALARRFRDQAGRLNQRVAAGADRAVMMVAGLPLTLKGPVTVELS